MNGKLHILVITLAGCTVFLVAYSGCANAKYDRGIEIESYEKAVSIYGVPPITQTKNYQCGYACMASVALYHKIGIEKLTDGPIFKTFAHKPLSAKELVQMANMLGLEGFAYKGNLDDLLKNLKKRRPVIVLMDRPPRVGVYPSFEWAGDTASAFSTPHWVVVTGIIPNEKLILHDPRKGRLVMSVQAFTQEWEKPSQISVLVGVRSRISGTEQRSSVVGHK